MHSRHVVITGMGVVSPLGIGVDEFWTSCAAGASGVRRIAAFDPAELPSQIAGEVSRFDPLRYMSEKLAGRTERFIQLVMAAAEQALDQSQVISSVNQERLGIALGSGSGGLGALGRYRYLWDETDRGAPDRLALLKLLPDMASSNLAIRIGARGPVMTMVAACVSSTQAIAEAVRLVRADQADVVMACGTEAPVTRSGMMGFCLLRALSTRNGEPERASRPFDVGRDGFVLAEGAAVLVLEELEHARRRGASVLAEILGYGQTSDASHLVMPDAQGTQAARCISVALQDAKVTPADIDYISAHGTSTPLNDMAETRAIKAALGNRAYQVPISSIKSMMGHALGAAGIIETVAAVMTLISDTLPPTINLEVADPECDLDYVPNWARRQATETVLKNSFGFGGQNVTLVLAKAPR